jgi:hypothetical protein
MKNLFTALLFLGLINYASAQTNLTTANALYFTASGNAGDGFPYARFNENWGIRFNSPDPRWVFSSKPSVLIGFTPVGQNWGNDNLFVAGNVGVGISSTPARLEVQNTIPLGTSSGSSQLLTRTSNYYNTNYYQNNIWVRRDAPGSDWLTTRLHDGISIDGSYLTPGIDTRTWWERSPFRDIQSWGDGNTTHMTLNQGRLNIGIAPSFGTQYKLAVAGSIGAWGEVRVFTNGSAFPDYVFDPSYKLPTLEETEKYVKENHHLPEVPSAAEIEKEGMSLNEMNVILLKKVEELTLYMIEMKKESATMKKENEDLKKRLVALENKK